MITLTPPPILSAKNVAAEPASKICESVEAKLEGRVIGTFSRVQTTVREAMREALIQLLTPKRRVDILRDVIEAKSQQRPYVIVFCGVNGVGKSTNLAKVELDLVLSVSSPLSNSRLPAAL